MDQTPSSPSPDDTPDIRYYYLEGGKPVGPLPVATLRRMLEAGILPADVSVSRDKVNWGPVPASPVAGVPVPPPPPEVPLYYYVDGNGQSAGPVSSPQLKALDAEGKLSAGCLVCPVGGSEWRPLKTVHPEKKAEGRPAGAVVYRDTTLLLILYAVTFSLWWVCYTVPCYTRDMSALTGRRRLNFTATILLGLFTLGLFSNALAIKYAYELEKWGKQHKQTGTTRNLAGMVIALIAWGNIISFSSGLVLILIGLAMLTVAVYLLQREFNLYAPRPTMDSPR